MEPRDIDGVAALQAIFLTLFTLFAAIGAYTTSRRLLRYLRNNEDVPLILWRDVLARNLLALPFLAILFVRSLRVFGVDVDAIITSWQWVVFTSGPAVLGVAIYAHFEIFIIERRNGPHETGDYPGTSNGH